MKKIILLLLFFSSTGFKAQVSRIAFGEMIFDQLYSSNSNPYIYDAANFPNPFLDIDDTSDSGKKNKILSYLEYGDGTSVFYRNSNFYPSYDISRGEAIKAIVEAWNIPSVLCFTSPFNDVFPGDEFYHELCAAYEYGLISGGTVNPYSSIGNTEAQNYLTRISNSTFHPVSSNILSNLDNYFVPNNYQPNNIGFLRGLEQGVFSHYAKNSFVIHDRKFNLNFSHYYSTQMVELPQSYFPIQPLGRGWTHTYNTYIIRENNVGVNEIDYYYIKWADGSIDIYNEDDEEYLTKGVYDELEENTSGFDIVITKKNQTKYYFDRFSIPGADEPIYYLKKIEDSNGNTVLLSYEESDVDDNFTRLKTVTAPSGKTLNLYYHNNTDLIDYIEDPISRQIRFTYTDDLERLRHFYDAKNQDTRYYYLAHDNDTADEHAYKQYLLRRVKLPRGNSIKAEYDDDDNGKLRSYQVNDNPSTEVLVSFDDYEAITSTVTVPMPNTGTEQEFNYQFNTIGMVTDFQNDNQNINISYPDPTDDNSLLPTNIDVNGLDINYSYDDRGNVKSTQIENNEDEDFWYDANNNLTHYRDSNNNDTYFNYDGNSNLMSIEDALGNFINLTYDSFGQVLSIANQEGITVNYTYEDDGAVSTIIAPENLTSSFSYDGINRLLSQTINGQTSSFIYDPNDNLTSQTNIGGLTTTFNYDGNDNLVTITNANGVNTSFTYNNEDQVTSETFNSLIKQYQYNDDGSLKKYTKPSGQEIEYDYLSNGKFNGAGTITDVDYFGSSGGKKEGLISHIYNANGHYEFNYDELNRLISVDDTFDNINDDIDYEYDDVGNLTRLSYPGTSHSLKYNYDAKNRLILVNEDNGSTPVPIVTYTYRKDDLLKTINYRDLITGEFSYDEAGRKIGVSYTDTNGVIFSENVEIDNKGNILSENRYYREENPNSQSYILPSESYTYNSKNHLLEAGGNTFSVNDDGNTTLRSTPAGIPGVNDPGVANFDYDVDDNLTNITNSNIPGYNKTYKYDPYGNRIEKSLGSNATKYTWDILNNNVLIIDTPNLSKLYNFYGATGLEYSIYGDTGTREYILYLGDLRGSVVAVANPVGDSSYNYNFNKYDDFGNRTYGAFGNPHQVFKYLGKHGITLEDVHTGHYYIKARHYDAITGRFLTQDPIWSTNLYPYGDNNPISRIDFNGKQSQSYFFRGGILGFTYLIISVIMHKISQNIFQVLNF